MTDYYPEFVTVSRMAQILQLSRSRMYQLINIGVLLPPAYLLSTRRPVYTQNMIKKNMEVKKNNIGINNQVIIFYSKSFSSPQKIKKPKIKSEKTKFKNLINELEYLGLEDISVSQIESAVNELFPDGTKNVSDDEILTSVFRHLKCRNSNDNVNR